jgi:O-antigen/teichoic acid export membrane protein
VNFVTERTATKRRLPLARLLAFAGTRTGVLALTTVGNLVVRTISSVLLTRLLKPYDFGIVGIITSVFFVVTMITDLGFEAFLIRHGRTEDGHFRDVIWTIHAKRGFALFVGVAIASPAIAWVFGKPVVALPLAVASLTFAINGLASLSLMTALRRDKARELSLLDFGLQLFSTITCLLLALWWRNAWSIIGAMVLQSGLRTLLSYRLFSNSQQRLARDKAISREFLAFSRMILLSSFMALVIGQSDKLVLGRLFTLNEFGLYAIALTISNAPIAFVESYVRRIAFPIYAQTWRQSPTELRDVYYRARRSVSALYALGCGGLMGGAPLLVALLYDPRYAAASTFISLLMIAVALRLPNVAASELLTATGDMKRMVRMGLVRLMWLAAAIPSGFVLFGTIGVVGAVGLIEVPVLFYCWIMLRRIGVLDLRDELSFLVLIAVGAAIGRLVGTEVLHLFPHL